MWGPRALLGRAATRISAEQRGGLLLEHEGNDNNVRCLDEASPLLDNAKVHMHMYLHVQQPDPGKSAN